MPGESLYDEIEKLQEEYLERVLFVVITILSLTMMVIFTDLSKIGNLYLLILLVGLGVVYAAFQIKKVYSLIKSITDYRLGLDGERYTGQALNSLVREGAYVFHDLQYSERNIDHVIVSTAGVFAVETKAFRKPLKSNLPQGKNAHVLYFDGKELKFPTYTTKEPLEQAKRSASDVKKFLAKYCTVDKNIDVQAILVFPGWFVKRTGKGDVRVGSAKELGYLKDVVNGSFLSQKEVEIIANNFERANKSVRPGSKRLDPDAKKYYDKQWRPKKPSPTLD